MGPRDKARLDALSTVTDKGLEWKAKYEAVEAERDAARELAAGWEAVARNGFALATDVLDSLWAENNWFTDEEQSLFDWQEKGMDLEITPTPAPAAVVDPLKAHVERLREALETIDREVKTISSGKQDEIRNDVSSGEAYGWIAAHDHIGPIVLAALSSTPAQSLADRDARITTEESNRWVDIIRQIDPERLCDFFDDHGAEQELHRWLAERDERVRAEALREAVDLPDIEGGSLPERIFIAWVLKMAEEAGKGKGDGR